MKKKKANAQLMDRINDETALDKYVRGTQVLASADNRILD
jgi:hypothetical protein